MVRRIDLQGVVKLYLYL